MNPGPSDPSEARPVSKPGLQSMAQSWGGAVSGFGLWPLILILIPIPAFGV